MVISSNFTIFVPEKPYMAKIKDTNMHNIKVSKILDALSRDGWELVAQKGSHRQYKHPTKTGKVTVNGQPSDVICGFLLKSIESQSGLKFT